MAAQGKKAPAKPVAKAVDRRPVNKNYVSAITRLLNKSFGAGAVKVSGDDKQVAVGPLGVTAGKKVARVLKTGGYEFAEKAGAPDAKGRARVLISVTAKVYA